MAKDPKLKAAGVSGYNKPKRTPNHPKKSHVVVAKKRILNKKKIKHVKNHPMQDIMHRILIQISLVLGIGHIKSNGN